MSRELKFRAWSDTLKHMYYHEDNITEPHLWNLKPCVVGEKLESVMDYTIMQYTGLKDKTGKEIYEGDIVKCIALSNDHLQRGAITISPIEYFASGFTLAVTYVPLFPFCVDHDIEVIGNIYENPELLKAKNA